MRSGFVFVLALSFLSVTPAADFFDDDERDKSPPEGDRFELTPSIGLRGGGEVEAETGDANSGASDAVDTIDFGLDESVAFGLTLDYKLTKDTGLVAFWSRQQTEFTVPESIADIGDFGLDVDYIHFGGVYLPSRNDELETFIMFTVGATILSPEPAGFDRKFKFSVAAGGGVKIPVSKKIRFRLEGRGYATVNDASFAGQCGPEACVFRIAAGGMLQVEALAGLSFSF